MYSSGSHFLTPRTSAQLNKLLAFIANPIDLYITISLYMKSKSLFNCLLNIIICADVRGVKGADVRAATVGSSISCMREFTAFISTCN